MLQLLMLSQGGGPRLWRSDNWKAHFGPLLLVLALGLLIRLALLATTAEMSLKIVDEQHYSTIARNLVERNEFSLSPGRPTSIRPPLYPFLIASIWEATRSQSLQMIRLVQVVLTLFTLYLSYKLGSSLYDARVGLWSAASLSLYPSYLVFNYLVLTEITFTLLLTAFVLSYILLLQKQRWPAALVTGVLLGLGALTRSILWPLPIFLCPLAFFSLTGAYRKRAQLTAVLFLGYLLVVAPWAVRNTRVQGSLTVVDTMGGLNLFMGNYEHTPFDRAWDAISLTREQSWGYQLTSEHPEATTWTEGQKQSWAAKKAVSFMLENPGLTLKRSVVKFMNFWGLERVLAAGLHRGLYQPPRWFRPLAAVAPALSYMAVMILAVLGTFVMRPVDTRACGLLVLLLLHFSALHSLTFGHPRYHLPLTPLLIILAVAALQRRAWGQLFQNRKGAALTLTAWALLGVIWLREFFLNRPLIQDFFRSF